MPSTQIIGTKVWGETLSLVSIALSVDRELFIIIIIIININIIEGI